MPRRGGLGLTSLSTSAQSSAVSPEFTNCGSGQEEGPSWYPACTESPLLLPSPAEPQYVVENNERVSARSQACVWQLGRTCVRGPRRNRSRQSWVRYPGILNSVRGSFFSLVKPLLGPWRPHLILCACCSVCLESTSTCFPPGAKAHL